MRATLAICPSSTKYISFVQHQPPLLPASCCTHTQWASMAHRFTHQQNHPLWVGRARASTAAAVIAVVFLLFWAMAINERGESANNEWGARGARRLIHSLIHWMPHKNCRLRRWMCAPSFNVLFQLPVIFLAVCQPYQLSAAYGGEREFEEVLPPEIPQWRQKAAPKCI